MELPGRLRRDRPVELSRPRQWPADQAAAEATAAPAGWTPPYRSTRNPPSGGVGTVAKATSAPSGAHTIRESVRAGQSLGAAMATHPAWFDQAEVAMVLSGQHAGTLPRALRMESQWGRLSTATDTRTFSRSTN